MGDQGLKVTNVKFINKETGETVLVLKEAEIKGFPLFFKWGEGDIDSGSCVENQRSPHFNGGQGK